MAENTATNVSTDNEELVEFTTPACNFCGQSGTVMLFPSELKAYAGGAKVQEAMGRLNVDDREQFISGTHAECWNEMFGDEEDEDY